MTPLESLRALMRRDSCDFFLHFNTDPFNSEYIGENDKFIRYLTGFSGSNAQILVSETEAILWTDGRYFIQAENEISKSGFKLYKLGVESFLGLNDYLKKNLKKGDKISFDIDYISVKQYKDFDFIAKQKNARLDIACKYIDVLWDNRPDRVNTKAFILEKKYSGETPKSKIKRIRKLIKQNGEDGIILNDLCDIAWILNLRANDIVHVPVFYSYLYIDKNKVILFTGESTIDNGVRNYLRDEIKDIEFFYLYEALNVLKNISNKRIIIDESSLNYSLYRAFKNCKFTDKRYFITGLRAVKNSTEIKNSKYSHINESVVLTKVIYYLKHDFTMTGEWEIKNKITDLRKKVNDYIEDSFESIVAYKENAAMMHYAPTKNNQKTVNKEGFLLIDTGGHYYTGTTDTTRTIAMGNLSEEEKLNYTKVLKAHLALMDAKFKKGSSGEILDILSRRIFWENGEDYLSGTGHGVGYLLSVHEGPNGIRPRIIGKATPLEPGMITTDEPGFYKENEYGIRIENELLCVKYKTTDYGQFYCFDSLTYVPYEIDAIVKENLTEYEKKLINDYHSRCYKVLKNYLNENEKVWLKEVTKKIV